MPRFGISTTGKQLGEDNDELREKAMAKSCLFCSKNSVCAIFGLFKSGIEPQYPNAIKTENLAWICSEYEEKITETSNAIGTHLSDKVLKRL
jgi:hypothetical protein